MSQEKLRKDENVITLGSGTLYLSEWDGETVPDDVSTLCTDENRAAYVKGGATINYAKESYTAQDDLGKVRKTIITTDSATLKCGLIAWTGNTLKRVESTARVEEDETTGIRRTKIGGVGNDNGKLYLVIFHHEDKQDGDCWWTVAGKNTAGLELVYSADSETKIEPQFTANSLDSDGTLIIFDEQIPKASGSGSSSSNAG